MNLLNGFISGTLKPALIIFGLATCMPLVFAISIDLLPNLANGIDFTQSSEPALRHWGFMVFGIGALLFASAFYPWLRFSTMVYSTLEKSFMVYLWLSNKQSPWGDAYLTMGILDTIICLYSILYFISSYGRPARWVKE
ncbi:MAG: hypothetical protein IPL53_11525 [Ignavibacteria bacterium]|nr:hypothetical protein [Ignavibacteria bacterium]